MLDGIAAAEILKGVRGADPWTAKRSPRSSKRIAPGGRFPRDRGAGPEPGVLASASGAIAADVRIVLDFAPQVARYRPSQEEIVVRLNRIMKPDAVAVIGASAEDGKIGNSVMKNLINEATRARYTPSIPKPARSSATRPLRA